MQKPIIVAHGGVGSPRAWDDGVKKAAEAGFAALEKGARAIDAVVAAVVVMEDDPRFNAGTGSFFKLDGTIEMDAAVMDSDEKLGCVAAIQKVKNPVKVARMVAESPHCFLAGEGATEFAIKMGAKLGELSSERAVEKLKWAKERLHNGDLPAWAAKWKYFKLNPCNLVGTVGAVAFDVDGRFAAASSTGGTSIMLKGRVGDSPIVGCGFYAGKDAAVTVTGIGEEIMKKTLSREVYGYIASGEEPQRACERGLALFPSDGSIPIGIIATDGRSAGIAATSNMAQAVMQKH